MWNHVVHFHYEISNILCLHDARADHYQQHTCADYYHHDADADHYHHHTDADDDHLDARADHLDHS
jgi:hypothetical protein